jgi:uncharacterized membrane protein YhhN
MTLPSHGFFSSIALFVIAMKVDFKILPFVIVAMLEIVGELLQLDTLIWMCKPLLMPTLAWWWWQNSTHQPSFLRSGVLIALLFSTAGDILLMKSGQYAQFFLLGLGAFLLAHVFYIRTYLRMNKGQRGYLHQRQWLILPFVAFLVVLLGWLWNNIPMAMKGAVAIYAATITTMALLALHIRGTLPENYSWWLFFGAVLFVLSDSLIAVNKFGYAFPESRVAIMSTYIFGQYAIARGLTGARIPMNQSPQ